MRTYLFLLFLLPLTVMANPPVWSRTGHRVVGEIAQQHLSRKAQKAVARILKGEGLAEVANYADDIKSDTSYRRFGPWHYVNFPLDKAYTEVTPSPNGDVVAGIRFCIETLKSDTTTPEDEAFYLKMLVHLVGDLHQPMHVGRAEDRGGNDIQLQWFDRGSNLHRVWDSEMIDDYGMSYTELAGSLPRWNRAQIKAVQQGDVLDWVEEIQEVSKEVYESVSVGEKLYYRYRYTWWDTVEEQLLRGGLRLAAVLNDIYG